MRALAEFLERTLSQPGDIDDRLRNGDEPFFHIFGHPITYNEVHAVVLGGALGLLIGEAGDRSAFLRTLLHEPWYASAAFIVAYFAGLRYRE